LPSKKAAPSKRAKAKAKRQLTPQQLVFVEAYLVSWNATRAALAAGYSAKTAYSQGSRLLKNVEVRALISLRMQEMAMDADEVLARLSDHARSSIESLLTPDNHLDLAVARDSGKLHHIKKLKCRERYDKDGNRTVTTEVELHDAQAALVHLGRNHKLFVDRQEHTGADGSPLVLKVVYDDPPGG
jgi:phage terminase small subunit